MLSVLPTAPQILSAATKGMWRCEVPSACNPALEGLFRNLRIWIFKIPGHPGPFPHPPQGSWGCCFFSKKLHFEALRLEKSVRHRGCCSSAKYCILPFPKQQQQPPNSILWQAMLPLTKYLNSFLWIQAKNAFWIFRDCTDLIPSPQRKDQKNNCRNGIFCYTVIRIKYCLDSRPIASGNYWWEQLLFHSKRRASSLLSKQGTFELP